MHSAGTAHRCPLNQGVLQTLMIPLAVVMRDKELSRLFGLVDPAPQTCVVCHGAQSPSLRPFDAREAMQRIDHWTADRAARKPKLSTWLKERP